MDRKFIASLPDVFYKAIIIQIQTMCMLKTQAKSTKSKPGLNFVLCLPTSCVQFAQHLLMDRDVFVKAINLGWSKV